MRSSSGTHDIILEGIMLVPEDGVIVDENGTKVVVSRSAAGTIMVALNTAGFEGVSMVEEGPDSCSFCYRVAPAVVNSMTI